MAKDIFQRSGPGLTPKARDRVDLDGLADRARALRARYVSHLVNRAIARIARATAGIVAGGRASELVRSR